MLEGGFMYLYLLVLQIISPEMSAVLLFGIKQLKPLYIPA